MTTTRLSASDWVDVGFAFLGEEGIQGIKIDRMAERLGVTKGSFYWHFKDLDDFLQAVASSRYGLVVNGDSVSGTLADVLKIDDETEVLRRDAAVDELMRAVSVGLTQRTGVVSVDVKTRYADLSVQICQRLLGLLNSFNLETRQSQAAAERQFVEGRLRILW